MNKKNVLVLFVLCSNIALFAQEKSNDDVKKFKDMIEEFNSHVKNHNEQSTQFAALGMSDFLARTSPCQAVRLLKNAFQKTPNSSIDNSNVTIKDLWEVLPLGIQKLAENCPKDMRSQEKWASYQVLNQAVYRRNGIVLSPFDDTHVIDKKAVDEAKYVWQKVSGKK
jgi:hypothetical protein